MANRIRLTDKQQERLHRWAEELRTTDKKQGHDALRNPSEPYETFCCLGIYGMMRKPKNWEYDEKYSCWELRVGDDLEGAELPPSLKSELGIHKRIIVKSTSTATKQPPSDAEAIFISLNDHAGWTFKQIANEVDYYANTGQISKKAQKAAKVEVISYAPVD